MLIPDTFGRTGQDASDRPDRPPPEACSACCSLTQRATQRVAVPQDLKKTLGVVHHATAPWSGACAPRCHSQSRVDLARHRVCFSWSSSCSTLFALLLQTAFLQPCLSARAEHASGHLRTARHICLVRSAPYLRTRARTY